MTNRPVRTKTKTKTKVDPAYVQAVTRALSILTSFTGDDDYLPLAELSRRTQLHKPTALRLARTLAHSAFMVQRADGAWRLGPRAGWIGSRYQAQFDVNDCLEPILQELSAATGESASFFVYEGNVRICLLRSEGPRGIRGHVRSGELLPLERGSAGRVILAALGEAGAVYDKIRRDGHQATRGEFTAGAASVSAPVHGVRGSVLGSVSISGPIGRLSFAVLEKHAPHVKRAAGQISHELATVTPASLRSTWHP